MLSSYFNPKIYSNTQNYFMLLYFFSIIFYSNRVKFLTNKNFDNIIKKIKKDDIFIIMLHTDSNYLSNEKLKEFEKASNLADGMFRFGLIDTKTQPLLARRFKSMKIPSYFVYTKDGVEEYNGSGDYMDIIEYCKKHIKDYSSVVDEKWKEYHDNNEDLAILFTKKEETPTLWQGISYVFRNKKVRIGICRDETMIRYFNISTIPSIFFFNKTYSYHYIGKKETMPLSRELDLFLQKRLYTQKNYSRDLLSSEEFSKYCIKGNFLCILSTDDENKKTFLDIKAQYGNDETMWFIGNKDLPWKRLIEYKYCIFNPMYEKIIPTNKASELISVLSDVDSQYKWISLRDFEQFTSELEL